MKPKLTTCLFIVTLLCACTKKAEDTSKTDAQIDHYLQLIEAKQNPESGMDLIKKHYTAVSDLLQQAGLKAQADRYLKQAVESQIAAPPLQGVDKTIQQALVILIHRELDQVLHSPRDSGKAVANACALYGGLRSTAERRGKYFGSDRLFTDWIEDSFKKLKDGTNPQEAVQSVYDAIDDIYFLSVLYELEGIAANRGVNEIIVQEKQIEGLLFYEIIHPSAKNSEASKAVRSELAKDGNEMELDLIKQNLKLAFPEKSARYQKKF